MDKRDELRLGFETAYIDGSVASNSFYSPHQELQGNPFTF